MKLLTFLAAASLAVGLGSTAHANAYDSIGLLNVSTYSPADGTFDITSQYDAATEVITSAVVRIKLADDRDWEGEGYLVKLDGTPFAIGGALFGSWSTLITGNLVGGILADLASDGLLDLKVLSLGDLVLKWADLTVETAPRAVPDGGLTLALFGMSLLGLVAFRRKLS